MYGIGLIKINTNCRDVLGIKGYGQSFLELAAVQQLKKNYGIPFVGIGARDAPGGHGLVCLDSDAGVHLMCNEEFAVPSSKRPTNRVICGVGGNFKAAEEVDNIILFNFDDGGNFENHFTALIARDCPHHLVSVGNMVVEDVGDLTLEKDPYGACHLDFGGSNRCTLHNRGVLILPFANKLGLTAASRVSFHDVSHDGMRPSQRYLKPMINHDSLPAGMQPAARSGGHGHGLDIDAATCHRRFGHHDRRILVHLPQASRDAPAAWREIVNGLKGCSCDACLWGKAHAQNSDGHVPAVRAPGDLVSFDIWQACMPHASEGSATSSSFLTTTRAFGGATSSTRRTTPRRRSTGSSTLPPLLACT